MARASTHAQLRHPKRRPYKTPEGVGEGVTERVGEGVSEGVSVSEADGVPVSVDRYKGSSSEPTTNKIAAPSSGQVFKSGVPPWEGKFLSEKSGA